MSKNVGKMLKQARKNAGISQGKAAKDSGLTLTQWSDFEREKRYQQSFEMLEKMAEAVNCKLHIYLEPK